MKREIKFRAWNIDDSEMISWEQLIEQGYQLDELKTSGQFAHIFMQFTGLKDMNGKEIYEGDMILDHRKCSYLLKNWLCMFTNGGFNFFNKTKMMLDVDTTQFEVIGNFYQLLTDE